MNKSREELETVLNRSMNSRLMSFDEVEFKECTVHFIPYFSGYSIEQLVLEKDGKLCIVYSHIVFCDNDIDPELMARKRHNFAINKFSDLGLMSQLADRGLLLEIEVNAFKAILEIDRQDKIKAEEDMKEKEELRERMLYERLKEKFGGE